MITKHLPSIAALALASCAALGTPEGDAQQKQLKDISSGAQQGGEAIAGAGAATGNPLLALAGALITLIGSGGLAIAKYREEQAAKSGKVVLS